MSDLREAFEAWFRQNHHERLSRNMPDKSYNDPTAHAMWIAYQAAHNRLAEPVRRMREGQSFYDNRLVIPATLRKAESEVDALIKETKNG